MKLTNSFTVPVGVDEAWTVLLDVERIAPCLPGAAIDSVQGDEFQGRVKVKLGPIALTYVGSARFVERDADQHRVVLEGRGRDQRGNGTAAALITAQLQDAGGSTRVDVVTDLDITGKPAQFGRGVMADVSARLIDQFAERLSRQIQDGGLQADRVTAVSSATTATASPSPAASPPVSTGAARPEEEEALDLLGLAGGALGREAAVKTGAIAGVVALLLLLMRAIRRSPGPGVTIVVLGNQERER